MNWNDAAEDLLHQVLGQTPYPVRDATEAQLRGVAGGGGGRHAADHLHREDDQRRPGSER